MFYHLAILEVLYKKAKVEHEPLFTPLFCYMTARKALQASSSTHKLEPPISCYIVCLYTGKARITTSSDSSTPPPTSYLLACSVTTSLVISEVLTTQSWLFQTL